jgi:hypothetical protein
MTKLTKTQKTLEQVFYQVKWKVDTVETVVNAKKGDTTEAITAGLDTMHAAASIFKSLPWTGLAITTVDRLTGKSWDDKPPLEKVTTALGFVSSILAFSNPVSALAVGTFALGLSVYALATDDSPEVKEKIGDLLTTTNQLKGNNWSDATDLYDRANDDQAPDDALNDIADSLDRPDAKSDNPHLVQPGDTLSDIAKDNGLSLNGLLALNPEFADNPDLIFPGQTLNLLDPAGNQVLTDFLNNNPDAGLDVINDFIDGLKDKLKEK